MIYNRITYGRLVGRGKKFRNQASVAVSDDGSVAKVGRVARVIVPVMLRLPNGASRLRASVQVEVSNSARDRVIVSVRRASGPWFKDADGRNPTLTVRLDHSAGRNPRIVVTAEGGDRQELEFLGSVPLDKPQPRPEPKPAREPKRPNTKWPSVVDTRHHLPHS